MEDVMDGVVRIIAINRRRGTYESADLMEGLMIDYHDLFIKLADRFDACGDSEFAMFIDSLWCGEAFRDIYKTGIHKAASAEQLKEIMDTLKSNAILKPQEVADKLIVGFEDVKKSYRWEEVVRFFDAIWNRVKQYNRHLATKEQREDLAMKSLTEDDNRATLLDLSKKSKVLFDKYYAPVFEHAIASSVNVDELGLKNFWWLRRRERRA